MTAKKTPAKKRAVKKKAPAKPAGPANQATCPHNRKDWRQLGWGTICGRCNLRMR